MPHPTIALSLLLTLSLPIAAVAQDAGRQDGEKQIGGITFLDDLDRALAQSATDHVPVIAYFTFDT